MRESSLPVSAGCAPCIDESLAASAFRCARGRSAVSRTELPRRRLMWNGPSPSVYVDVEARGVLRPRRRVVRPWHRRRPVHPRRVRPYRGDQEERHRHHHQVDHRHHVDLGVDRPTLAPCSFHAHTCHVLDLHAFEARRGSRLGSRRQSPSGRLICVTTGSPSATCSVLPDRYPSLRGRPATRRAVPATVTTSPTAIRLS